jgi:hypothetical protein
MDDKLFRFIKHVKLVMTEDFEQNTVDDFRRLIGNLYNQSKTSFDISDFSYLFKFENLTKTAKTNFINNYCNIKFTSMSVNQVHHRDDTPFTLNLKVRDNLKHIYVWYVLFSDYYTIHKEEDNEIYYFEKDDVKYEFNKQKLKNCNISVQSI